MAVESEYVRRLDVRLSEFERSQDRRFSELDARIRQTAEIAAALEDRTKGQRERLAAVELGYAQVNNVIGRIEDRAVDRGERLAALEKIARETAARPTAQSASSWITLDRVLIAGVLIGLAFARLGIDPSALVK